MKDTEDKASVALALDLIKGKRDTLVGEAPDDEELAAFYDDTLEPTRRAQVIAYLANHEESYITWLNLVQTGNTLALKKADEHIAEGNTRFITRIKNTINAFFNSTAYMSGAAFTAILVIIVSIQLSTSTVSVNHLYEEYGAVKIDNAFHLPSRGFNLFSAPVEAESIILSQGFLLGLERLGENDSVPDLHVLNHDLYDAEQALDHTAIQVYLDLGQWAAISYYQCKMLEKSFIDFSQRALDGLQKRVVTLESIYAKHLVNMYTNLKKSEENEQVCEYAAAILTESH